MNSISNNGFIMLTRGDTFKAPLFINKGSRSCPVRYYIKDHPEAIIKKFYTSSNAETTEEGDIIVTLKSTDTEYLLPGKYYYEVKIDLGDSTVYTIIPKTEFFILS